MAVLSVLTMRSLLVPFVLALTPAVVSIAWTSRSMTALASSIAWMSASMATAVSVTENFLTPLLLRSPRSPRPPRRRLASTCFVYSVYLKKATTFNTVSPSLCLRFRPASRLSTAIARKNGFDHIPEPVWFGASFNDSITFCKGVILHRFHQRFECSIIRFSWSL